MARTASATRYNIVLLMADQLRGDAIGCDGNSAVSTPNIDRLAAEGVRFARAYSSLPSCTPARASLLTGMSPWNHGLLGYGDIGPRYKYEKPRMLREAGYYTLGVGKMHYLPQRVTHGFHRIALEEAFWREEFSDDYRKWLANVAPGTDCYATGLSYNDRRSLPWPHDETLHPTHWTAQQGIDFLNTYRGCDPYFLKVSFQRPHPPFDPPLRFLDMYRNVDLPTARVGKWAENKYGGYTDDSPPEAPRAKLSEEAIRSSREGYYGAISFVDEQIGRVLDAIVARGDLEKTLILFTADHGEMLGDHNLWRKTYAYEGSARIPMIIRWPEDMLQADRGQARDELVELRDVLPSFLDAAGAAIPADMNGRSMLDLLRRDECDWRRILDLEHGTCYFSENAWTALTDGRWKYIYHAFTGEQQLFDMQNDPCELNDLAQSGTHMGEIATWRDRMVIHLAERGEPWVVGEDLGIRTEPIIYGPNYPGVT